MGGTSAQKATVCLSNSIEPIACVKNASGGFYTISYQRNTDDSIIFNVSSINVNLLQADGKSKSGNGGINLLNGAADSIEIAVDTGAEAKEVTITSVFELKEGGKQTCTSAIAYSCK